MVSLYLDNFTEVTCWHLRRISVCDISSRHYFSKVRIYKTEQYMQLRPYKRGNLYKGCGQAKTNVSQYSQVHKNNTEVQM